MFAKKEVEYRIVKLSVITDSFFVHIYSESLDKIGQDFLDIK